MMINNLCLLTKNKIRLLLNNIESDRVERTISTTNTDKFGQAICASDVQSGLVWKDYICSLKALKN